MLASPPSVDALEVSSRQRWMSVLAQAAPEALAALWARLPDPPAYDFLRRPEIGLAMVRGRIGGDGAPFNLGEMTVTRCSVRCADGRVGHAWIAGRAPRHAELAAALDVALQDPGARAALDPEITALAQARAAAKAEASRKAAATKVEFFTLVRGDN